MRFSDVRDLVAELLLSQRRHKLPIDPLYLSYPFFVHFTTIENYCKNSPTNRREIENYSYLSDGITITTGDESKRYIVIYNEAVKDKKRIRFTIAHEVGHIMLLHNKDGDEQEKEANIFAAELLMPEIVINEMVLRFGENSSYNISQAFGVSKESAQHRLASIVKNREFSDIEEKLLERYKHLIPALNQPIIEI